MKPPWIWYDAATDRVFRDTVVPETAVRLMPCPYPMTDAEIEALHDEIAAARRAWVPAISWPAEHKRRCPCAKCWPEGQG